MRIKPQQVKTCLLKDAQDRTKLKANKDSKPSYDGKASRLSKMGTCLDGTPACENGSILTKQEVEKGHTLTGRTTAIQFASSAKIGQVDVGWPHKEE